jgi:hypothetical protein
VARHGYAGFNHIARHHVTGINHHVVTGIDHFAPCAKPVQVEASVGSFRSVWSSWPMPKGFGRASQNKSSHYWCAPAPTPPRHMQKTPPPEMDWREPPQIKRFAARGRHMPAGDRQARAQSSSRAGDANLSLWGTRMRTMFSMCSVMQV